MYGFLRLLLTARLNWFSMYTFWVTSCKLVWVWEGQVSCSPSLITLWINSFVFFLSDLFLFLLGVSDSNLLNRTQSGPSNSGLLLESLVSRLWLNGLRTTDGQVKMCSGILGVFLMRKLNIWEHVIIEFTMPKLKAWKELLPLHTCGINELNSYDVLLFSWSLQLK